MARKKIKLENSVGASVPLSSMIDVVFLLLIYFIFTQKPVVEDVHLQLNLPAPQASSSDEEPPPIVRIDVFKEKKDNDEEIARLLREAKTQQEVNDIRKKEILYYGVNTNDGGGNMLYADLENYLITVAKHSPETTIVVNCGPNAKHKKLVKLLDLCNKLGLVNINLVNADGIQFVPDPVEDRNK